MNILEVLNTDIQSLNLSTRAIKRLNRSYQPKTVLDLINLSKNDLYIIGDLGKQTLFNIENAVRTFIEKHIDIFNQYSNQELMGLGLNIHAFRYIRDIQDEHTTITQTADAIQTKIDIHKQEITNYYAAIETIKKLIAEKEFEIAQLQKEQKTRENSEIKK